MLYSSYPMRIVLIPLLSLMLAFAANASDFAQLTGSSSPIGETSLSQNGSYEVLTTAEGVQYQIPAGPYTLEQQALLDGLSLEERRDFELHRATILKGVARILGFSKLTFGFGHLAGGVLSQLHENYLDANRTLTLNLHAPDSIADDSLNPLKKPGEYLETGRQATVETLLLGANQQLYESAPVVSGMKEYGFSLFAAVTGGGNVGTKGFIRSFGIGFNVGYDRDSRELFFQLYSDYEKFAAPIAPVTAMLGVIVKPYLHIGSAPNGQHPRVENGKAIYPFGPCALTVTSHSAGFGPNITLGIPSSPFDTFLAYINSTKRLNLLRLRLPTRIPNMFPNMCRTSF